MLRSTASVLTLLRASGVKIQGLFAPAKGAEQDKPLSVKAAWLSRKINSFWLAALLGLILIEVAN